MDLIITRELANIYICKTIEKMLLAEFKVLHIINSYAALPVKHLIKSFPSSEKHITAMCCTNTYIYQAIEYFGDIYVYNYKTNECVAKILFYNDFEQYDNIKLTYCNGIVHYSYNIRNYKKYILINAETHEIINTFNVIETTYLVFCDLFADEDGVVSEEYGVVLEEGMSAIAGEYMYSVYNEHSDSTNEFRYYGDNYSFSHVIYYFKHETHTFTICNNILVIYSTDTINIYYIDELVHDLNDHIMAIPRNDAYYSEFLLQYNNILYIVEWKNFIAIDLNKKTYYIIPYTGRYTAGCIAPNGNLLLANNKFLTINEYF